LKDSDKLANGDKVLFALIFFGLLLRPMFVAPVWTDGEARGGLGCAGDRGEPKVDLAVAQW